MPMLQAKFRGRTWTFETKDGLTLLGRTAAVLYLGRQLGMTFPTANREVDSALARARSGLVRRESDLL